MDGEGGDRRWRRVDAFLQRLQGGITVRRVKRVAIITQGGSHHARLTESAFHTLHDLRWRDILGSGIAPPALQKEKIVRRYCLLSKRHLEEISVPGAFEAIITQGQIATRRSRVGCRQGDYALDAFWGEYRSTVGSLSPPIMPNQTSALGPKSPNQGHGVLRQQDCVACEIDLGVLQLGGIFGQLPLGLGKLYLKQTRIDFRQ